MVKGSIDLGTNTCLLFLGEWSSASALEPSRILWDESTVVRLGQGVDKNRTLHPEAMARTEACLLKYRDRVKELGARCEDVVAVTTSSARDAANSADFFSQIEQKTGFRFRVLSGEQEAQATFLGALLPGMSAKGSWVLDIGGGSTEWVSDTQAHSIDMGSVRFTERFFSSLKDEPVTDAAFWACQEAIDEALQKAGALPELKGLLELKANLRSLVAVAGTATTIAQMQLGLKVFDANVIDGLELTRGDVHRWVEELKWRTPQERAMLAGMEPARADVILAGAMILWRSLEVMGFESCKISTRGLRYGVLNPRLFSKFS